MKASIDHAYLCQAVFTVLIRGNAITARLGEPGS